MIIDWSSGPDDAEYARHWMNGMTFFKPCGNGFWLEWVGDKWIPTAMCNAVHCSLVSRPIDESVCGQCRGEGRVGGMDPALGGKNCSACDGTGMDQGQQ